MYKILCINGSTQDILYTPGMKQYALIDPKLSLELNKSGTLTFGLPDAHPNRDKIIPLMSDIVVYDDATAIFYGRSITNEKDFYKTGRITCEGELSFLFDSLQRAYTYTGTLTGYLTYLIGRHNAMVEARKRFSIGNITVVDGNNSVSRSSSVPVRTLAEIQSKLVDVYGGYIQIRHSGGATYIDYLAELTNVSTQKVEFAKNIVDLNQFFDVTALRTCLIPLGAKQEDSEEYLTIESVNGGLDYITDSATVTTYGQIWETVQWPDITTPAYLLTNAQNYLNLLKLSSLSIKLTAVDLSKLDADIGKISLGDWLPVKSVPHAINTNFLVSKKDISLADPAMNTITLGDTKKSLSLANKKRKAAAQAVVDSVAATVKQGEKYNSISIDRTNGFMSSAEVGSETRTVKMNGTEGFVAYGEVAGQDIVVTMSPDKPFELSIDGYPHIYVKNGILVLSPCDVNEDGYVDTDDLDLVASYVLSSDETFKANLLAQYPKMDVNHSGTVSSSDLTLIARAAGMYNIMGASPIQVGTDSGGFYTLFNGTKVYRYTP